MPHTALIVGATGIVGQNLANRLVAEGWTVHGLARRTAALPATVLPVAADVLDMTSLRPALAGLRPSHLFFTTWSRRATEAENCAVNSAMLRHVFAALPAPEALVHSSLVTGLKHYLGPFEAYAKGPCPRHPSARACPGSISRISTTPRKTPCSKPPPDTVFRGASTVRTPSSATPSAMS